MPRLYQLEVAGRAWAVDVSKPLHGQNGLKVSQDGTYTGQSDNRSESFGSD